MPKRFLFDGPRLASVVGGQSAIDMPRLNLKTKQEADEFIKGYGYDLTNDEDHEKLWYFYRRTLVLLQEKLGYAPEEIPEIMRDRKNLEDLHNLLIWASSRRPEDQEIQKWACAILRVMHVFVHSENDLFSSFAEEIQKQILAPIQSCIFHDGTTGTTYLKCSDENGKDEPIALLGFELKPFKTSSSTVIKLLAKADALAMNVFDKIGVRFVTGSMFDAFRVLRFLMNQNLISFPHVIPDQSSNNLYPIELFLQACDELMLKSTTMTDAEINQYFDDYLEKNKESASFLRKENAFSGADYRFLKLISRKLIRIPAQGDQKAVSFFYPYEVQILDKESHSKILSGPSEHQAYKDRQKVGARKRIFPEEMKDLS